MGGRGEEDPEGFDIPETSVVQITDAFLTYLFEHQDEAFLDSLSTPQIHHLDTIFSSFFQNKNAEVSSSCQIGQTEFLIYQ